MNMNKTFRHYSSPSSSSYKPKYFFDKKRENDFDYVIYEVGKNGHNLKYAGELMRNNLDICMTALKSDKRIGYKSLNYIGSKMRSNPKLLTEAIFMFGDICGHILDYFEDHLIKNFSVMLALLEKNPNTPYVNRDVFDDEAFCRYIISECKNPHLYHNINDVFKTDESFILRALSNHVLTKEVLLYIPDYLKDNDLVFFTACNSHDEILYIFSNRIRESRIHAIVSINSNKHNFKYISSSLKKDIDIIKTMILLGSNIKDIIKDDYLLNDKEFMDIISKL